VLFYFWPQYRFNNSQKDKNFVPFEAMSARVLNSKAVDSADYAPGKIQIRSHFAVIAGIPPQNNGQFFCLLLPLPLRYPIHVSKS
jgi:hypothetical protein